MCYDSYSVHRELIAAASHLLLEKQMRSTAGTGSSHPTPTTIPTVADPDPPPSSSKSAVLNSSDLAILRLRLPNLAGMLDAFLQRTSLADLTALHSVSAAAPTTTSTHHPSPSDHAKIMSLSLAALNSNPTDVPGAPDDCLQLLHPGRFLAGAVCDAGQLWLAAKAAIGPSGLVPLSSYDMEAIGLSGCVTARG